MPRGRKSKAQKLAEETLAEEGAQRAADVAVTSAPVHPSDVLAPEIEIAPVVEPQNFAVPSEEGDGAPPDLPEPRTKSLAETAYERMRIELAEQGAFPAWDDLPNLTRGKYEKAADACQKRAPLTRFEEIVLEVAHG